MTTSTIYKGDLEQRATSHEHLAARIAINHKYASTDFDAWLFERLEVRSGMDVLDVGCGDGAQTIPAAERVGASGSVSSLDIAADSVATLTRRAATMPWVQAVVSDMAALPDVIDATFRTKQFDLALSAYALYYSAAREQVLDVMRRSLKDGGRLAVFTPYHPHGLVDLARRFGSIPPEVDESLAFGPGVLEPYFRRHFWDVSIHFFHNELRIPSAEEIVQFYRATTYWSSEGERGVRAEAERQVAERGYFEYEKNGYLIIGRRPR